MKRLLVGLTLVCLLTLGGQAFAEMCAIDAVPAASLLLPYFEVGGPSNMNTMFTINNASDDPALAHVIVWSNWSWPAVDFDVFLTGYDVVVINVGMLFDGYIPITADEASDPGDTVSPHAGVYADNPLWDGSFLNCVNFFPFFNNPMIQGNALDRLVNGCSGNPVAILGGNCGGDPCANGVDYCGYITVDNVWQCSLVLEPSVVGYFVDGGLGIAIDDNQLWGDYYIVDFNGNFAFGDTLVHLEAEPFFCPVTNYTFYGRYVLASCADNREPLGTTWAVRYLNGPPFDQTDLIVWRDSTVTLTYASTGFTCGVGPDWFPLNEIEVIAFDEYEDAVEICFFTGGLISPPDASDPACFPYETGRYTVDVWPLALPFDFGWLYLNLNLPPDAPAGDVDFPVLDALLAQSHVTSNLFADGMYSVGLTAIELTSACYDENPEIGMPWNNIPQYAGN